MLGLRTLVLNANYAPVGLFPLHTIPVEDAITRVFNGTCHVVYEYDRKILTPSLDICWPSVIARNDGQHIDSNVKLRKDSLFYRDHGVCAYCEKELTVDQVTFDHVMPRKRGGHHGWDNVVAACADCNSRKSDALPEGMWKPKHRIYKPTIYDLLKVRRKFPILVDDRQWVDFIGDWEGEVRVKGAAA